MAAEPYVYENLQDILLPLVKKRYEWLPYNYTLAWENASQGLPLVRPIGMHDNNPDLRYVVPEAGRHLAPGAFPLRHLGRLQPPGHRLQR